MKIFKIHCLTTFMAEVVFGFLEISGDTLEILGYDHTG